MDYFIAIITAGLVAAFIISAIDYWVDLGLVRAVIAVVSSLIALILIGEQIPTVIIAETLAASFVAMFLLQIVARLNEPPRRR
jgi:hypothetical protein